MQLKALVGGVLASTGVPVLGQRLREFRAKFDMDQDYVYAIFSPDEHEVVGGTGLHTRVGQGALDVGGGDGRGTPCRGSSAAVAAVAAARMYPIGASVPGPLGSSAWRWSAGRSGGPLLPAGRRPRKTLRRRRGCLYWR